MPLTDFGFNFDPAYLLLSLIPSAIGGVLFFYGKKQQRMPQMVAGALLAVYPYTVETVWALVFFGLVIGGGLWAALELGW